MSLSNPTLKNPCKKFIEFKGDIGVFRYWDKDAKKNIELKYPFTFIVLDELSTITGYNDQTASGVYSNEVRSVKNQTLNVRTFKGNLKVIGKYADIKAEIGDLGGKYTKSVYAAMVNGGTLELVNFQLKGISFKSWVDKDVDVSIQAVKVATCSDGKKGRVEYKIPNYEPLAITEAQLKVATDMDRSLQEYLKNYESIHKSEEQADESVQPDANNQPNEKNKDDIENDDIPF